MHIQESDWKKLRHLKGVALERLCTQILEEIGSMVEPDGGTSHQRFLKVYRHIHDRNADIAEAFYDVKRFTAIHRPAAMRAQGLVTDEELDQFTEETRGVVSGITVPAVGRVQLHGADSRVRDLTAGVQRTGSFS